MSFLSPETCGRNSFNSAFWVIMQAFFVVSCFIFKIDFSEYCFRNTTSVSNSLDPDQGRRFVGPDLGPNCLQKLSADITSNHILPLLLSKHDLGL